MDENNRLILSHIRMAEWIWCFLRQSVVGKTLEYVKNQGIHHKKMSFQDEYQKFLESYGVEYNKEYVFKD